MTKELILLSDVEGLGLEGEIVKVSAGYARNYLFPKKLAGIVTQATLKRLEKTKLEREERHKKELEAAQALAATIEKISCTIPVKVDENDKLFGSVTVNDIVAALKQQNIEMEKSKIHMGDAIKELGVYPVKIKLHPQVEVFLKVWVVGE
jgi:large subunit ribosomal protein L9